MRLMEAIRRKGNLLLKGFLIMFVISVFAGLGVGFYSFSNRLRSLVPQGNEPELKDVGGLVSGGKYAGAVMLVNGEPVTRSEYADVYQSLMDRVNALSKDPWEVMYVYGYLINQFTTEGVLLAKARELGVTVSSEDIAKAKQDAIASYVNKQEGKSGNVVSALGRKLGAFREEKRAYAEFLERTGVSEQQWESSTRRQVLLDNTRKKLQEQTDTKKKTAAEEVKKKIDASLAKGEKFAELSRQYSDDATASKGGDIGTWVGRGLLFDEKVADKVFSTPLGQITEWFDIPAGFQRFEVYDKREAQGPEFEAQKPKLIEKLQKEKGKDYKPADDDLKKAYEAVKFRQILLRTTDEGAADKAVGELAKAAKVEINDPYLLAYQALIGDKLQPPAGIDYDALVKIAKNSLAAPDYDFSVIKTKLAQAKPEEPPASSAAPGAPAADAGAASKSAEAKGAADGTVSAGGAKGAAADGKGGTAPKRISLGAETGDTAAPGKPVPLYSLTVGLLNDGLQRAGANAGALPYFLLAKTYSDWLGDDEQLKKQAIDRDKARQKIAEYLAQVVDMLDYNASAYAYQGLNLAWMQKKDEAVKALESAQKYAPREPGDVWDVMRKAYTVLGDEAKAKQIEELSTKLRQEAMQKRMQQAMQQQGGGQSTPIQIPPQ
jgi:parvulin-like peptidyl-prolyl isomerase